MPLFELTTSVSFVWQPSLRLVLSFMGLVFYYNDIMFNPRVYIYKHDIFNENSFIWQ